MWETLFWWAVFLIDNHMGSAMLNLKKYCPSANDLIETWNSGSSVPKIYDQGWVIKNGGGVATRSSFNLLGGYVEYDIDLSTANPGVNANIYTISPNISHGESGYTADDYCDAQMTGNNFCLEVDWIESNGNCGGATTIHTEQGPGYPGCNAWGCGYDYHYNGRTQFHVRIEYAADGMCTVIRDGQTIEYWMYDPQPDSSDSAVIKDYNERVGSIITSTQWTGWVPVEDCSTTGDLASSSFSVSNLVVFGSVVQGPTPTMC